jgi:hypothetical protein
VGHLESLKTVARFRFFTDYIKNRVDKLGTFSVVALGPVVTSSSLSEDEVVRAEKLTERSGTDGIHGSGLKIEKNSTRDVSSSSGFVEINVDTFELEI